MKLCIATHNEGKLKEFRTLLEPLGYDVVSLESLNVTMDSIVEDGLTFRDNARIKSKAIYEQTGYTVLSDDSGLCIRALPDILGVHSARFLGEETSYDIKLAEILNRLEPYSDRSAFFVCAISLYGDGVDAVFEGTCEGVIADKADGHGGFGYDPIFIPEGHSQSFASLSPSEKHSISHRGRAVEKLCAYLKADA